MPRDYAVPRIAGGKPAVVVVPPCDELRRYIRSLGERADAVRGGAKVHQENGREDNMLVISGDGRRAALDLRLVGLEQPPGGKLDVAAEQIASLYQAHRTDRFEGSERAGALQLVFCDTSTPGHGGFNAYDGLTEALVRFGVPRGMIRYIHEANTDRAKADLFAQCRAGTVAVLVGSTERMGTGVNIQHRAVALHHLDCPWRPADVEQREGRILRQGNSYPEVGIYRYVVEGSFDVYMWQTVERKSRFIAQLLRGTIAGRSIEDLDTQVLSYAEVKALAAGNPLILEKVALDSEFARLDRLRRAHGRERREAEQNVVRLREGKEARERSITALERYVDCHPQGPIVVPGESVEHAGDALVAALRRRRGEAYVLCEVDGCPIRVEFTRDAMRGEEIARLRVDGVILGPVSELANLEHVSAVGVEQRVRHLVRQVPTVIGRLERWCTEVDAEIAGEIARSTAPFSQEAQWLEIKARREQLTEQLRTVAGEAA